VKSLTTSKETTFSNMAATFGFEVNPKGLNNSQLDALRATAQQQGYYTTTNAAVPATLQSPSAYLTIPHPVLFYDFKGSAIGQTVDLKDLKGYSRTTPLQSADAGCTDFGAIVVVLNGNVKLNGSTTLVASVFVPGPSPNGQVNRANGTGQLIGTLYADNIDMTGTADVSLDSCFLANLPGRLLSVTTSNYREEDR